jgi:integrase/recombinase XerD
MLTTIEPPRTAVAAQSLLLTDCRSDQQLYSLWIARFRSRETIRAYEADWQRFHAFCPLPLHDLRVEHLQAYLQHMENLQLRPDTVRRRVSAVKSLLSYGARLGYLPINVGAVVKMPERVSNLRERILPAETVAKICWSDRIGKAARHHQRNQLLVRVLYTCGLRLQEALKLRWRDIQPHSKDPSKGILSTVGKRQKLRHVVVKATTYARLMAFRPAAATPDDWVFPGRNGGPLSNTSGWRIVKAAMADASVPAGSAHWLRHCFASHALDAGADLRQVSADLGHSSIAITGAYLHVNPEKGAGEVLAM